MPVAQTLTGIFLDSVAVHRSPAMFMRKGASGWESISGERALADVESLALALGELGVVRGDRVALLSENRFEWPVTDLAVLGLGGVTVPIYPSLTAPQVRGLLENSEAKVVVVSSATQLEKLRVAAAGLPHIQVVIAMSDADTASGRERDFGAMLRRGAELRAKDPGAYRQSAALNQPGDLATIIYTSGTTGEPKGAMLSHGNIAFDVAACLELFTITTTDTCLSFLPLCHVFERMGLYGMLAAGATVAFAENFEAVAENAREVRPTILLGVPRFFEKVHARVVDSALRMTGFERAVFDWGYAKCLGAARARFEHRRLGPLAALEARLADRLVADKIRARVGGRIRFCISGGAPLPAKVMEFFAAIGIPVYEGYGLTETSPVICINPPGRSKLGSVGPPVPGVEVRIGDNGEILTRGPHVMLGYFHNPTATEQALQGGWFHTGDIGHLDADGYLVITDRLKDLLVTAGGKKVAPQPIEAKLKSSPWVSEAVLLGDGKPYVICLFVPDFGKLEAEARTQGNPARSRDELLARPAIRERYQAEIDRVNQDLAQFEKIKRFAILDRELTQESGELTPTLKVKRRVIVQRFAPVIEELYAGHVAPAA